jgi:hypothetical protein
VVSAVTYLSSPSRLSGRWTFINHLDSVAIPVAIGRTSSITRATLWSVTKAVQHMDGITSDSSPSINILFTHEH